MQCTTKLCFRCLFFFLCASHSHTSTIIMLRDAITTTIPRTSSCWTLLIKEKNSATNSFSHSNHFLLHLKLHSHLLSIHLPILSTHSSFCSKLRYNLANLYYKHPLPSHLSFQNLVDLQFFTPSPQTTHHFHLHTLVLCSSTKWIHSVSHHSR